MQVLDFSTSNAQISDEIINVSDSNPINLRHSVFYNKTGKVLVARNASGGGGTLLVETTDYTLGGAFPDADFPTSISPDVGYTTIAITNATYQNVNLYIGYYPIMDIVDAGVFNNIVSYDSYTASKTILDRDVVNTLNFDLSGNGALTCTLPDATVRTNEVFRILWSGGTVSTDYLTMAGDNIGGVVAGTWLGEGEGVLSVISNGTDYEVLTYEDTISIADSGSDSNRVVIKNRDGNGKITGIYDPGTFNINSAYGIVTNMNISAEYTALFGYTVNSVTSSHAELDGVAPISAMPYSPTVTGIKMRAWYPDALTSRTENFKWFCTIKWRA